MLAFLPVVGVGMGYLLGADPIAWFLGSSVGAMVFAVALALTIAGTVWTRRIVQQVERGLV
jgi:tight adherence protein B